MVETENGSVVYRFDRPQRVLTVRMPSWLYDAVMHVARGKCCSGNSLAVAALMEQVERNAELVPLGVQLDVVV